MSEQEAQAPEREERAYWFQANIGPLTKAEKDELDAALTEHIAPVVEKIAQAARADGVDVPDDANVIKDYTEGDDGKALPCGHTISEHRAMYASLPDSLVDLLNRIGEATQNIHQGRRVPVSPTNPFEQEIGRA